LVIAALDYRSYALRRGRYSRGGSPDLFRGAFERSLPPEVIAELAPGDVVFLGSFGWWLSWLIMYLTSSRVSHVALYAGRGKITHATLSGTVVEPIESLFGDHSLLLPCKHRRQVSQRELDATIGKHLGRPYSKRSAILKGLRILLARDWPSFRWKFFVDVLIGTLVLDAPMFIAFGTPVLSFSLPAYLFVIIVNCLRWRLHPLPVEADTAKPSDVFAAMVAAEADFLVDPSSPLVVGACGLTRR